MNNKTIIALISSIVMMLGIFLPMIRDPFSGTRNYFTYSGLEGAIVLICSISAIVLAANKKNKILLVPGGIATIILFIFYVSFQSRFLEASRLLADAPQVLNQFSGLMYGFYIMFISTLIVTTVGIFSLKEKKE